MKTDNREHFDENTYNDRSSVSIREIQEMAQIEKGLEDFLKKELGDINAEAKQATVTPAFDEKEIRKEVDWVPKKTLEVADFVNDNFDAEEGDELAPQRRRNAGTVRNESYEEDWDRPRKPTGRQKTRQSQGRAASRPAAKNSAKANEYRGKGSGSQAKRGGKGSTSARKVYRSTDEPLHPVRVKKKKSGFKKFVAVVLIFILILGVAYYFIVNAVYSKMNYESIDALVAEPLKDEDVVNILLIGNDSRENGEDGRSDAMILLSINSKAKKIYMTSLLRDMYVDIPGHDGNRLNAAYAYGGAELLMETVEKNLDIEVNRYVLVNFEAFANLVDAVGGVDLELSSEEVEYVNAYLWEYNVLTERPEGTDYMDTSLSGVIHLNGPQSLAYSRNRYIGTDFGRTERQRKVLSAVIKKLPSAVLTNSGDLINGLMPNLTTNLTKEECYRLGFTALGMAGGFDIVQSSIPQEGTYKDATIRGMAVLEVDFDVNKKYIRDNIYSLESEE